MEQTKAAPPSDAPVEGKIVSAGKPAPVVFTIPSPTNDAAAGETAEEKEARELAEKNKLPELSDDQLKELLKGKGIELDDKGFDGLKEKLKPAAPAPAPEDVAAEKAAAESAFENRMLNHFIANGGTAENFVALKQVAAADLKSLSASEIRREMKEAQDKDGKPLFDDDAIALVIKERYYQINPEELEQGDNETTEEFEKRKSLTEKKIAFGANKFESKSSHIKKQAEDALNTLREVIKLDDSKKEEEVKHSKRVEDFFTKLQKKITLELGKAENGNEIAPIEYVIPDEIVAEVKDVLTNPEKRNKFLYNEDNSLNLDNVASVMLRNKYLEALVKDAYLDGDDRGSKREVEKFEKIFPGRTAKDIGVGGVTGGNANARKGHIVSRGAPEPVRR